MSRHSTVWWAKVVHLADLVATEPVVTSRLSTAITLTWTAVTDATGYVLQRSADQTTWTTVYTGTLLTYTDTGLTASTPYYYRLAASQSGGTTSPYSPVVSTSTP